jgi:hypothetical protein
MLLDTGTEEISHIELLATAVALNLEGAPLSVAEAAIKQDGIVGAVLGGMNPRSFLSAGLGAMAGEQQLTATGEIIGSQKLLWGAISTLGYLVVPFTLRGLYRRYAERCNEHERWGFRFLAYTTVTTWGMYPLGYMLTLSNIDLNYIHLSFSIADIFNKVGVAIVAYLVGKHLIDERLDEKKVLDGHEVG